MISYYYLVFQLIFLYHFWESFKYMRFNLQDGGLQNIYRGGMECEKQTYNVFLLIHLFENNLFICYFNNLLF